MRPSCRRYLCFLLAVCFIINEQEVEGTAPCIIFREREKHASMGRALCNRKHCKLKGKDPVRGSDKYQYSLVFHVIKKHFQSVHGRQMFTGAALSASSLHSHAGLLSSCAITEAAWFVMMHIGMWSPFSEPLTFWLTEALRRMCVYVFVHTWNGNLVSRLSS